MAVLEGSLEHFALPDVFRLLAYNRVTGALNIERESGDGVIYFREGEVYFAFSSLTREFLGQRLVNAKLITQGQLLRLLDEQKKAGGKRLGELLVEKGYLSRDLLDTFIKEQIQDSIFNLLQWDRGTFVFEADVQSPQEVGLSVSVENLIMESSRRIEEWEVIRRKIPTMDAVVRMSPTPPESAEINIKPEEWTLLVLADGRRTVKDIAAAAERSDLDAAKIIYGLVTAGLLDVASGPDAPGQARAAAAAPSPDLGVPAEAWMPPGEPQADLDLTETAAEPSGQAEPAHEPGVAAEADEAPGEAEEAPIEEQAEAPQYEEPAAEVLASEPDEAGLQVSGAVEEAVGERVEGEEPELQEAQVAAGRNGDGRKTGDPTVSKEMLLRLIAGVRNL